MQKEDRVKCKKCNKEISKEKYGVHLKNKHYNEFDSEYELYKHYFLIKENFTEELFDCILKDYSSNSVVFIEKKYNFAFRGYIKKLGLKERTIGESKKLETVQSKTKKTNLEKYGSENVSSSEIIKKRKKETLLRNYGVDNFFKMPGFRKWWELEMLKKYGKVQLADIYGNQNPFGWLICNEERKKERIRNLNKRYLDWYNKLSIEEKDILIRKRCSKFLTNDIKKSKLEERVAKILEENNLIFKRQYWITRKSYDFKLNNRNILEIQGDYWHCNPNIYKENDLITFGKETRTVKEIWEKDKNKKNIAENYGYKLFYLWESEMKLMNDLEILNFLKNIYEN